MSNTRNHSKIGQVAIQVLVFSAVSIIMMTGFILWAETNINLVFRDSDSATAFMVAEAGIEYYRWHLAHDQADYQDGTGQPGPYVHNYYDKDGNLVGTFTLDIVPPSVGSTVVTIHSTGRITANPATEKIVEARLAIPSFAKYAAVVGSDVRFGAGTDLFGPVHSNGGIRMDGVAHNVVTSALGQYDDPDHSGSDEFGVHTHVAPQDPFPPAVVPSRSDIFMAGRQFPVAPADFSGITQDLAQMKIDAQASGSYWGPSGDNGYEIELHTDDTYDVYVVNSEVSPPSGCYNLLGQSGWGTWSVNTRTFISNNPLPGNGIIFIEDDAWVSGQIDTARVTIASGRFPDNPSTRSSITTNADLLYTNYDGQDIISLIAQENMNVGMVSDTDLRVDAALMAQNGRVGRYYYRKPWGSYNRCAPHHSKNSMTSYGMIGSFKRYGWAYSDNTGYTDRIIIYDANLLYAPPPSFPLTADYYTPISWDELK